MRRAKRKSQSASCTVVRFLMPAHISVATFTLPAALAAADNTYFDGMYAPNLAGVSGRLFGLFFYDSCLQRRNLPRLRRDLLRL